MCEFREENNERKVKGTEECGQSIEKRVGAGYEDKKRALLHGDSTPWKPNNRR